MNQSASPSNLVLFVALILAVGSPACGEDPDTTDSKQSQLDAGPLGDDGSLPVDAETGLDAPSPDAGPEDTGSGDASDATRGEDEDAGEPAALTLAGGIELVGVQAFQTIETTLVDGGAGASSDIPLIAGRETLFRVLVAPEPGWQARDVTAQIVLTDGETAEPEIFEETLEVTQASRPEERSSVFELRVPEGVITSQTSASFRLIGDGELGVETSAQSAARWPRDASAMALGASEATGRLHLVLVPMRYDHDGSGRLPDTSPAQITRFREALRAIYPAHELLVEVRDPISWTTSVDWGDFNRELRALKQSDGADDAFYYGVIRPAQTFEQYCGGSCTTGQSFTISSAEATSYRVGSGLGFSGERWAWTLVHELGHMHGRGHAPCGVSWWSEDHSYPYGDGTVGVWGWDRRNDALFAPDAVTDFMGYCDDLWVSDYTYLGLVERMSEAHALQQTMSFLPTTTWRYVNWSTGEEPSWGRETQEQDPSSGEWAQATFLDEDGLTLAQRQIPLIRYAHDGERSVLVPRAPAGAMRLRIATSEKSFVLSMPLAQTP